LLPISISTTEDSPPWSFSHTVYLVSFITCHAIAHFLEMLRGFPLIISSAWKQYNTHLMPLQCCCNASSFHWTHTAWCDVTSTALLHGGTLASTIPLLCDVTKRFLNMLRCLGWHCPWWQYWRKSIHSSSCTHICCIKQTTVLNWP